MLDIGIIKNGTERVLRCECGRVELSYNGVRKKITPHFIQLLIIN